VALDPFTVATDSLSEAGGRVSELARPFLRFLPVSGASVSTFGTLLGAETVSATDALAGRVDELQFDLGEGPCWDALATRRPILEPDFAARPNIGWPAFTEALRSERIGSLFAFPLLFGPLEIGAVDLYSVSPVSLTTKQQDQTTALSAIVSRLLLSRAIQQVDAGESETPFSRRLIHQATGMVIAQAEVSADDAYLLIQARAFAESRPMQEVARDLVDRRFRFSTEPTALGETP